MSAFLLFVLLFPLHLFCLAVFVLISGSDLYGLRRGRVSVRMLLALMLAVGVDLSVFGAVIRHVQAQ